MKLVFQSDLTLGMSGFFCRQNRIIFRTYRGINNSSKVVGRRLDEISLPDGVTIGAIVRGEEVIIAHSHIVVNPDDHVILFLIDRSKIRAVEKLFAVGLGFFS